MLEALRTEGPLEADQLAERVGLHVNTVRAHLDVLGEAGLVRARALPASGPGRPRLAFAATEIAPDDGQPGAYLLLARILTASLEQREDGPECAASAARAAGREMVETRGPRTPSAEDRRGAVLTLLDRVGFAPRPAGDMAPGGPEVVELHHCPFRDLAQGSSAIVCSIHRGILEGAFERLGGNPESLRLVPFVAPGLCTVHLDRS